MSARPDLGGQASSRALSLGNYAPSGSILLPPADPPLERSQISQALIDGFAVVFGLIFLCATAASLPLALFILIFVRL